MGGSEGRDSQFFGLDVDSDKLSKMSCLVNRRSLRNRKHTVFDIGGELKGALLIVGNVLGGPHLEE